MSDENEKKIKKPKTKAIILTNLICISIIVLLAIYLMQLPLNSFDDLRCEYKSKFSKIVCTQTGDIVPDWFNDNAGILGNNYSMSLIFEGNNDYMALKMTDRIFIKGLKRKFIYEINQQTLFDYFKFKEFAKNSKMGNWGSIALYCSEDNLKDQICKNMKKYNK